MKSDSAVFKRHFSPQTGLH